MDLDNDKSEERELYGFGQNEHGELGLGDTIWRPTPTLSDSCSGKEVVHAAAGNGYTVVLTNTGEVYSCGLNNEGQCGIGQVDGRIPETVRSFTKVSLKEPSIFPKGRVGLAHTANGSEHLLIVTEEGQLQTCGCNAAGQLGHGNMDEGYGSPTRVTPLMGYRVTKVACSFHHTVVVTSDDVTWTFGGNAYGQLGLGHSVGRNRAYPTPIPGFRGNGVLSVACGLYHTVLSVAGGGMYAFGKNDHGQLGLAGDESRYSPTKHPTCTTVVKQLACGYFHTVALGSSGEVLAFGRNDYGQLGLGHRESTWQASQVPDLAGKAIIQVACGCYHTISLDADGRVYPFGRNNHGQLGTGTREDSCRPCFVEKLSEKFVCQVAAGFYHTLCVTGPTPSGRAGARTAKSLSSDLYHLLNNPSRSDVTFLVENKSVYGHRCIIGARCEPLGRMLDGAMKEASSCEESIPLPDDRHDVFLAFLEFLYTDKVLALGADLLDLEFCLDLLEVADRYLVDTLKRLCETAILKNITAENACELLMAADGRRALSLRGRCADFVVRNKGTVSATKGYASLPASVLAEFRG